MSHASVGFHLFGVQKTQGSSVSPLWWKGYRPRVRPEREPKGTKRWDHTNAMFWQMRGWELRGWLCEAIRCAQYFSVILLVQQHFAV